MTCRQAVDELLSYGLPPTAWRLPPTPRCPLPAVCLQIPCNTCNPATPSAALFSFGLWLDRMCVRHGVCEIFFTTVNNMARRDGLLPGFFVRISCAQKDFCQHENAKVWFNLCSRSHVSGRPRVSSGVAASAILLIRHRKKWIRPSPMLLLQRLPLLLVTFSTE